MGRAHPVVGEYGAAAYTCPVQWAQQVAALYALSRWSTHSPRRVLRVVTVFALICGAGLLMLENDPSPEAVGGSHGTLAEDAARFVRAFGDSDQVAMVVVEAEDIFAAPVLDWMQRLTTGAGQLAQVARVDAVTSLPMVVADPSDDDLDDLNLDALDADPSADEAQLDALMTLIEANPDDFPDGMLGVSERMGAVTVVKAVQGPKATEVEAQRLRDAFVAGTHPFNVAKGALVDSSGRLAIVAVQFKRGMRFDDTAAEVNALRALVAELKPPAGVKVQLSGLPLLRVSIVEKMQADQAVLIPMTLLVCALLLWFSFRWWVAVVAPLVTVGVAALVTLGLMGWLGITLTILTNVVPALLIIIGISDSIHVVARYREELMTDPPSAEGGHRAQALRAVHTMAVACLFTSVTTSIGLGSLALSDTRILAEFGVVAALGVMGAYFLTVTLLPAALVLSSPPAHFFEARGEGKVKRRTLDTSLGWLVGAVVRRPVRFLVLSVLGAAALLPVALEVPTDVAVLDQFDKGEPEYETARLLEDRLGGILPVEVLLEGDREVLLDPDLIKAVHSLQTWVRKSDVVIGTQSYVDLLASAYGAVSARGEPDFAQLKAMPGLWSAVMSLVPDQERGFLDAFWVDSSPEGGSKARIQIRVADVGAKRTIAVLEGIQARLSTLEGRYELRTSLSGNGFVGSYGVRAVLFDLMRSLVAAILIIGVVLGLLFRSVRLGILSMPPNTLPLLGTLAFMATTSLPLNAATAIIFTISVGLAVDGTIHMVTRYLEERERLSSARVALMRSARGTGRAIVVSSFTLMCGFGVMLTSAFLPVRQFGELVAITVAFCLISTLVMQPVLLVLFARRRPKIDA